MSNRTALAVCAALLLLVGQGAASAHAGEVAWRSEQPAPPPGAPFSGPVGTPADLQFLAPNLGLMLVGRSTVGGPFSPGLLIFDGAGWRQLSTVCGGGAGRIAFASGREWWTANDEALKNGGLNPITLCHYRDGAIVNSFAVAQGDTSNAYHPMSGAACISPSSCWFGGTITDRPTVGTFLLHWDGSSLRRIAHPAARGISDLQPFRGQVLGGAVVGPQVNEPLTLRADLSDNFTAWESLVASEPAGPRLLRALGAGGGVTVPAWAPRANGVTDDNTTEMVDLGEMDTVGDVLWLSGRGSDTVFLTAETIEVLPVRQRPFLAVIGPGESAPREIIWEEGADLATDETILDIAGIPGTDQAWLALGKGERVDRPSDADDRASLARVNSAGEVLERIDIARPDLAIGDAARVDCPAPANCWMVTAGGWLYHWSDPDSPVAPLGDPVLQGLITSRPVDARTPRDEPDTLPADVSAQYVAPPVAAEDPPVEAAEPRRVAALFRVLGKPRVRKRRTGYVVQVRIQLRRKARVQLQGRRKGKVVARSKRRTLKKGRYTITMRVKRKRWPTALRFVTRDLELAQPPSGDDDLGGDSGDTVTTGSIVVTRKRAGSSRTRRSRDG